FAGRGQALHVRRVAYYQRSAQRETFVNFIHQPLSIIPTTAPPYPLLRLPMDIKRAGSQPSSKGPADWFTGTVRVDPLFQARDPARAGGASVTFEPGAR